MQAPIFSNPESTQQMKAQPKKIPPGILPSQKKCNLNNCLPEKAKLRVCPNARPTTLNQIQLRKPQHAVRRRTILVDETMSRLIMCKYGFIKCQYQKANI